MAAFAGPVRFDISDLAVSSDGAIGYSHSIQHVRSSDSQGHDMDMTVRVTDVYRKQDGRWRIVQEHVSAPIDLATLLARATLVSSGAVLFADLPRVGIEGTVRQHDLTTDVSSPPRTLTVSTWPVLVICSATRAPSSCAARTRAMNSARAFSDG